MTDGEMVTLREFLEREQANTRRDLLEKLAEYRESHGREHVLLADAIKRAQEALIVRLEGMNEFRAQLEQERASMMTRDTFDAKHEALEATVSKLIDGTNLRVSTLETGYANLSGRITATTALLVVGLGVLEFVLKFVVR
jgi:hypothetical protein